MPRIKFACNLIQLPILNMVGWHHLHKLEKTYPKALSNTVIFLKGFLF